MKTCKYKYGVEVVLPVLFILIGFILPPWIADNKVYKVYEEIENADYAKEVLQKRMRIVLPDECMITNFSEGEYNYFEMQVFFPASAYQKIIDILKERNMRNHSEEVWSPLETYHLKNVCEWWDLDYDKTTDVLFRLIAGLDGEPKTRVVFAFFTPAEDKDNGYLMYFSY